MNPLLFWTLDTYHSLLLRSGRMTRIIHLITNPKGGVGDNLQLAHQVEAKLTQHHWRVIRHETTQKGHAEHLSTTITTQSDTILCGIGGDGTMHEIINGLMRRNPCERVPVASIPGGTGNSFMEDTGITAHHQAIEALLKGQPRSVDLLKADLSGQTRYVFNVCGWGLFASGNLRAESLRWMGAQRYNVAGLLEILRNPTQRGKLILGNEEMVKDYSLIVASNSRYVGKGMLLSPKANFQDGLMDLLYLKKATRPLLLSLFSKLHKGRHAELPEVCYQQTDQFEIHCDQSSLWNLDGEITRASTGKVQVIPSAIEWIL